MNVFRVIVGLFFMMLGVVFGLYIGVGLLIVAVVDIIQGGPLTSNIILIISREFLAFIVGGGLFFLGQIIMEYDD